MKNRHVFRQAILATVLMNPVAALCMAEGFVSWRGSDGTGAVSEGTYPTVWSNTENVDWRIRLSGRGASSPIIVEDRIILTAADETKNFVIGVDTNGKKLWSLESGNADTGKNAKATGANSSPVSDGKHVFAYFKSGELVACDLDGKKLWSFNLQEKYGEDTLWWDLGTSPVLTEDAIVIAVMQSGPSFLVAFDKATGNEIWKTERQFNVNNESNQAYTTPAVTQASGKTLLLTLGADHLTAHDAKGKLVFSVGGFNPKNHQFFRSIASPVVVGDLVICPYARGESLTAVRLADGLDENARIAWVRNDLGTDVPTPSVNGEKLYLLGDKGAVSCIDSQTGKTLWSGNLPRHRMNYSSSPVYADGKLYCTREDATTFVVDVNDGFKLLAENKVEGQTVATPLLQDGKIYLRTYEELICIK